MHNFASSASYFFDKENTQKLLSQPVDFDYNSYNHGHTQDPGLVSLTRFEEQFPDISLYIYHGAFPFFATTWLAFQKVMLLARNPLNRSEAQAWLRHTALTIHGVLACVVKSSNINVSPESQARVIFSALRRLKDRMEIMYQVIQIIENGRVLQNQGPIEALKPIIDASKRIQEEVKQILLPDPQPDNASKLSEFEAFYMQFMKLNLDNIPNDILNTYHMIPYHPQEINIVQMNTPNQTNQYAYSAISGTDFKQPDNCTNIESKHMIKPSRSRGRKNELIWIQEYIPAHHNNQHKSQVKLSDESDNAPSQHSSKAVGKNDSTSILRPAEISKIEPGVPGLKTLNTASIPSEIMSQASVVEYQDTDDEDQEQSSKTDDDDDYIQQEESIEDDDISPEESPKRSLRRIKTKNTISKRSPPATRSRKSAMSRLEENKKRGIYQVRTTRRTATSYDSATTHYLKSVFFDIYSHKDKLNKEQRRQVQAQTGLKPRNITYWFSNHKRRFRHSLTVYRRAIQESQGAIKNYEDFVNWRKSNGLPEEVMDWET